MKRVLRLRFQTIMQRVKKKRDQARLAERQAARQAAAREEARQAEADRAAEPSRLARSRGSDDAAS